MDLGAVRDFQREDHKIAHDTIAGEGPASVRSIAASRMCIPTDRASILRLAASSKRRC